MNLGRAEDGGKCEAQMTRGFARHTYTHSQGWSLYLAVASTAANPVEINFTRWCGPNPRPCSVPPRDSLRLASGTAWKASLGDQAALERFVVRFRGADRGIRRRWRPRERRAASSRWEVLERRIQDFMRSQAGTVSGLGIPTGNPCGWGLGGSILGH